MNRTEFHNQAKAIGLELSERQLDDFDSFEERLYEVNKTTNLTRIPKEECWIRHFLDSLLFAQFIPAGSLVLDIGTGPGFPAWPLACARPDVTVTALDATAKMLDFLRGSPLPNLTVVQFRAEEFYRKDHFDVVTGRALAPLSVQLELSACLAKLGGFVIPMRTPSDHNEIERFRHNKLGLELESVHRIQLRRSDVERIFPIYRKSAPTPKKYPRSWAEVRNKPL